MQTYNPTLLEAAVRALLIRTMAGQGTAGRYLSELANYVQSDKRSEQYAWIGESPRMRELGKDREVIFDGMSDASYTLTAATWAAGIVVKREDIEDDQLGAISMRIQQLARVAAFNPDRLLLQAIVDGTTNTCYDGVAFFSDTHTARGQQTAAGDNIISGTGTSTAQVSTDLASAIERMMSFVSENGEPFHDGDLTRLAIVCGPALRKPLMEALGATIISNTSNVQVDGVETRLMVSGRLTGSDWYLFHTGGADKPLIFQDRVAVTLEAQEAGSEPSLVREQYRYKVRGRHVAGYAHWQNAVKIDN